MTHAPLIAPDGWSRYEQPGAFTVASLAGGGTAVSFVSQDPADLSVYLPLRSLVFYVPAGATVTLAVNKRQGPTVTAPAGRALLALFVNPYGWHAPWPTLGLAIPEWWTFEVADTASAIFERLPDDDVAGDAAKKGIASEVLEQQFGAGQGSIWVRATEEPLAIATLPQDPANDGAASTVVRTYGQFSGASVELDTLTTLLALDAQDLKRPADDEGPHPVLRDAQAVARALPLTLHVRFVMWLPKATGDAASSADTGSFQAVPDGSTVTLQGVSGDNYTALVTAPIAVNGGGQVALSIARDALAAARTRGDKLHLALELPAGTTLLPQYQHGNTPREPAQGFEWSPAHPNRWLTLDQKSTDGQVATLDTLYEVDELGATAFGAAAGPIEYYAGVPIHLKVEYPFVFTSGADPNPRFELAMNPCPKGVQVDVVGGATRLGRFFTDERGEVHGTVTRWSPGATSIDVQVIFVMQDPLIQLPPVEGAAQDGGQVFNSQPFAVSLEGRSIGTPAAPVSITVGEVQVHAGPPSRYDATGHAPGVLFALQQYRYAHQWWRLLTDDTGEPDAQRLVDKSWATMLGELQNDAREIQHQGTKYTPTLPFVSVTDPVVPGTPVYGATELRDLGEARPGVTRKAWAMQLYARLSVKIDEQILVNGVSRRPPMVLRPELWRTETVWHEHAHVVMNVALERLNDLDMHGRLDTVRQNSGDRSADAVAATGWHVLEEGIPQLVQAAVAGAVNGTTPTLVTPPAPGVLTPPSFMQILDANGAQIGLDAGEHSTLNDERIGLRVPLAFAWALWSALERGGLADLRGALSGNDLEANAAFLTSAAARTFFRRVVWGPMRGIRTATVGNTKWEDIGGDIEAPTALDFVEHFRDVFYPGLAEGDKAVVRDLYGDVSAPDPVDGSANSEQVSYYLWFQW